VIGALFALASALVWGIGDFLGGRAASKHHYVQVVALSTASGIAMLVVLALLFRETIPSAVDVRWAALGGIAGAIGIASLYQGLAIGNTATVAPTAAVITAALPVAFGALTIGLPRPSQLAGFALALIGIWLVARTRPDLKKSRTGLKLAVLAGFGFGGFLILIAQVEAGFVFTPLAIARSAALVMARAMIFARRIAAPSIAANGLALTAGLLDAGGNVFYMWARQHTRIDVAAVLSSLYPVATVMLARIVTKDPVTRTQWIGAAVCLAAVGLITM
jgi:drug/metabolite transporter (DMT)-like permease